MSRSSQCLKSPSRGIRHGMVLMSRILQITCLYDMDIPRPENFNETYLYEGRNAADPLAVRR
jgi:hypothetical protein